MQRFGRSICFPFENAAVRSLDAGGFFDGETDFDQVRSIQMLHMMTLFGYRAMNITPDRS